MNQDRDIKICPRVDGDMSLKLKRKREMRKVCHLSNCK